MKIAVAGATGYIGGRLVPRLVEEGHEVVCLARNPGKLDGRPWRGAVDIVTAGYPCQPFSLAGRRRGSDDPRHLWPHIARIVRECAPPFAHCLARTAPES